MFGDYHHAQASGGFQNGHKSLIPRVLTLTDCLIANKAYFKHATPFTHGMEQLRLVKPIQ